MGEEETAQEQPQAVSEQAQDQQAEQAIDQAATTLEHRLDEVESNEAKCVALLVRMAHKIGYTCGIGLDQATDQHFAAIDLPNGTVSWFLLPTELAWFDGLSLYDKPLEPASYEDRYERILSAEL